MLWSRCRRAYALLFAIVFLGSGFALPDLDALLYHSSRVSSPDNTAHLDLPGGCGAHSERCALTLATPVSQLAPQGPQPHSISLSQGDKTPSPPLALPFSKRTLLHQSRAPPVTAS
jgi:hypothetical protein